MRLHQLEITAFGPFATTVSMDLDDLAAAGLFLLSGPTGAGKTSVLDAICFALYGDVPGDRNAARRLRCDQATPGVAPRVVLETTLSGRRFRITRSPAWERPKKRGAGTTTQQASVVVLERVAGEWAALSTRLDESGHLLNGLIGMTATQFTQVAMLPQGRFQAFLRARSEDRHKLLQQLFRTARFEDVERWLREHRIELRRRTGAAHARVAEVVSRVSEADHTALPDGWDVDDLTLPSAEGCVEQWVTELHRESLGQVAVSATSLTGAISQEAAARTEVERGRSLLERTERVRAATAELRALDAAADDVTAAEGALTAARRAAVVVPLHRVRAAAARIMTTAEAACADRLEVASAVLGDVEEATDLLALADTAGTAAADVRAALPREGRLRQLREAARTLRERVEVVHREATATLDRRTGLPDRLVAVRAALDEAVAVSTELVTVGAGREESRRRLAAHATAEQLTGAVELARISLTSAHLHTQDVRERWLSIREARLEGMAAEIAGALAVGSSCPVCGSCEHPQKAAAGLGGVDAEAEREALRAVDDAKSTEHLRDVELRELESRLAAARRDAGPEAPEVLAEQLASLEAEHARLTAMAATAPVHTTELKALEAERDRLDAASSRLGAEEAAIGATLIAHTAELTGLETELDALLRQAGSSSLAELLEELESRATLARTCAEALAAAERGRRTHEGAVAALEAAAADAGFGCADDALAAQLAPPQVERLEQLVVEHHRRRAAVLEVLAGAGGVDPTAPVPDVAALGVAHDATLERLGDAKAAHLRAEERATRLAGLRSELEATLATWAPLRGQLELATSLCAFVEGKSPDNRLQMRLSAYVLSHRLSQVVAAANERLARMSDQRYSLEHTARRSAGETRGGLSLAVRDDWSGESRDPVTLSGGETFVVSLALALGLADVITQEAGGADVDTLFVDEGFGSLDAETLDDVMDTLDTLRDGGRVVGVVSHVAEMRDRIPAQLVVTKSRAGSTVAVRR